MSRFLMLSSSDGVGMALRMKEEGHEVQVCILDPTAEDYGKGLIDTGDEYHFGQTIIADCTGFGPIVDSFKASGVKAFSGSSFADRLEGNRRFTEEVMHRAKIETPQAMRISSWSDAASAVKSLARATGRVVIKPEGKLSGVVPSYVSENEEDALAALEDFEQQAGSAEPELTIQEFIEGVAVSTEGWFNGEEWVEGMFNHTIEKKKSLNDDLGPDCGCAGNVVWKCDSDDPLVTNSLTKLTDTLRKHRYIGPIDINCVVNEEGIYGLEFTPRFGYDALPTLLYALCDFDFGAFVQRLASGHNSDESLLDGFGFGVRLTLPKDTKEAIRIGGLSERDLKWFYPYAVQSEEDGLRSVSMSDHLGVVNGFGDTIDEAASHAYRICSRLEIRNLGYRTDLAEVFLKDFRALKRVVEGELVVSAD